MENKLKVLCLDIIVLGRHDNVESIHEEFVDPKSEPFSTLCKRAEMEGVFYDFKDDVLHIGDATINTGKKRNQYNLFWYDWPYQDINKLEIK